MYKNDEIIVNGKKLNEKQKFILIEAIGGHIEYGVQNENFLIDNGISVDEQVEILNDIDDLFIR